MIDLQHKVIEMLQNEGGQALTTEQLALRIGISVEKAAEVLYELTTSGQICTKKNNHYIARESLWGWICTFNLLVSAAAVMIMYY
ncbi:hypothetical protein [Bacillus taeanensis]|uniref:Uncharacterized protein n=1 Tax=Bacillus taeanensis TaxID=273032 RepID=A0A366XQP0_9BACI|nr:hypothetical protein [Bacillus taeanensis]RBW67828.1 hypothetical protein DS031_19985 [Bacillus taeanensis]